jgi:hypothetical protein
MFALGACSVVVRLGLDVWTKGRKASALILIDGRLTVAASGNKNATIAEYGGIGLDTLEYRPYSK